MPFSFLSTKSNDSADNSGVNTPIFIWLSPGFPHIRFQTIRRPGATEEPGLCFRHYQWPSASGQGPHPPSCRLLRRELEQRLLLGEHIDRAVRPHSHVADAGLEFSQQRLLGHHLDVLELLAIDADAAQAVREQAAAPLREKPAVIISQARRGDHRVPVIDRLLHALLGGLAFEHRAAGIIDAVGNDGPAVIPALPAAAALLAAAPAGTLGVTEHGPRGGDELN